MPISPNQGPTSGGTNVTITGVNLSNAISVYFGANLATITANTPTMITVTNPPGNGVVNVYVVTPGGKSNSLSFFYIPFPIITSVIPSSGNVSGGNTVTITGLNLFTANNVSFGANSSVPTIISDTEIQVVTPAGAGSVPVSVTTAGGTSSGFFYTYIDVPSIITITPDSGSTLGGTSVTISGTEFSTATSVTFGGVPAAFGVINSTTIVAITPAGAAGAVDVVVTTNAGSATAVSGYTYVNGPGI